VRQANGARSRFVVFWDMRYLPGASLDGFNSFTFICIMILSPRSTAFVLLALAVGFAGCGKRQDTPITPSVVSVATIAPVVKAEPWATLPTDQWPQLVLTNRASFNGHTPLKGASAFLVEHETAGVIAVTAAHLLGENGGVEPALAPATLDSALAQWRLYPRTLPESFAEVAGLASVQATGREYFDWLALRLKPSALPLPSHPLHLRAKRVHVGETVHLIGVSYAEPLVRQKVYTGKVIERHSGDRFRFSLSPAVNIMGFSGAPILDENGQVVGVLSIMVNPTMQGEEMIDAGGEDAASLLEVLR
jgi:hypothetical protein